jgi:twitching motility protein PilT
LLFYKEKIDFSFKFKGEQGIKGCALFKDYSLFYEGGYTIMAEIFTILEKAVATGASDIHITVGRPPMVRIHGSLIPLEGFPPLSADDTKELVYSILYDEQKQRFEANLELDCSYHVPRLSRFRVNVLMQKDGVGMVMRVISSHIPTVEELGLTQEVVDLAKLPRGLILVTGPTGSGKSTTLACIVNLINQYRNEHILTIEDPIEFVYEHKSCVVTQRELGNHTLSFTNALRAALREDPDVIMVGEMRDLDTISLALTAAETGHLVLATLHTTDAPKTVDRIIDVFPPYQQQQIRMQLSVSLKAVICQNLVPKVDGHGRVAAREIMFVTTAVANLIRENKTHMIYNAIDTGAKLGMISMDKSLANLVSSGVVSLEEALTKANDPEMVRKYLGGAAYAGNW